MRIGTRLHLNTSVALAAGLLVLLTMAWTFRASEVADRRANLARSMRQAVFDRSTVRDEYLLNSEARALGQWRSLTRSLQVTIEHATAAFDDPADLRVLQEIREAFEVTENLLLRIVASRSDGGPAAASRALARDSEEVLVGQIILKGHTLGNAVEKLRLSTEKSAAATRRRALYLLAACLLGTVAVVVVNSLVVGSAISRSLARIGEGTRSIGGGDLAHRIEIGGDDELWDLARATNAMAAKLQASLISNDQLEERVRDRTAQLEAVNRELEAFSYTVSHDLRAPLRHLTGFAGLLKGRMAGTADEKTAHYLDVIDGAARQMGQLVDDLLSFSRMGRAELMKSDVSLDAIVRETRAEIEDQAKGRTIAWRIGELPEVVGDRAMLTQVFANLLGNAVKFTGARERPVIEVGSQPAQEPGQVCVFVRDNGAGFDMQYVDKLFGLFQRLHHQSEFEGTGVGLANVRRIVTRHGGRVWAEGVVGQGATFYFTLPSTGGIEA